MRVVHIGRSRKAAKKSEQRQDVGAKNPVEWVYSDMVGSTKCLSKGKEKYLASLLDEHNGYSLVRF